MATPERLAQSELITTVEHATALAAYVASRGKATPRLQQLCKETSALSPKEPLPCELIDEFAELSRLAKPATGKSLVDSARAHEIVKPITYWAILMLIVALASIIVSAWLTDVPEPEEGPLWWAFQFYKYGLETIAPFVWGALGSCVYLLKRLSDLAEARVFDEAKMKGFHTRILLGAILGGVVQFIYDPAVFTDTGLELDANALGFLSGVGVKIVYGAIEKTITALGEAMNLDSVRKTPAREQAVRKFLADEMAAEPDAAKRQVIAQLLEKVDGPATAP